MDIHTYVMVTLATMVKMVSYFYPAIICLILWETTQKYIKRRKS